MREPSALQICVLPRGLRYTTFEFVSVDCSVLAFLYRYLIHCHGTLAKRKYMLRQDSCLRMLARVELARRMLGWLQRWDATLPDLCDAVAAPCGGSRVAGGRGFPRWAAFRVVISTSQKSAARDGTDPGDSKYCGGMQASLPWHYRYLIVKWH